MFISIRLKKSIMPLILHFYMGFMLKLKCLQYFEDVFNFLDVKERT